MGQQTTIRRGDREVEELREITSFSPELHEASAAARFAGDPASDRGRAPTGRDHQVGPGRHEGRRPAQVDPRDRRTEKAVVEHRQQRGTELLHLEVEPERLGETERLGRVAGPVVREDPDPRRIRLAARAATQRPRERPVALQRESPGDARPRRGDLLDALAPPLWRPPLVAAHRDLDLSDWMSEALVEHPGDVFVGSVLERRVDREAALTELRARTFAREHPVARAIRLSLELVPDLGPGICLVGEALRKGPPRLRVQHRIVQHARRSALGLFVAEVPGAVERTDQVQLHQRSCDQAPLRLAARIVEGPHASEPGAVHHHHREVVRRDREEAVLAELRSKSSAGSRR